MRKSEENGVTNEAIVGRFKHLVRLLWDCVLLSIKCCANIVMRESRNFKLYKKQNIFSKKQKGFRDGLSYSTPQKSEETRGNAITQSWSHPIKKM